MCEHETHERQSYDESYAPVAQILSIRKKNLSRGQSYVVRMLNKGAGELKRKLTTLTAFDIHHREGKNQEQIQSKRKNLRNILEYSSCIT